MKYKFTAILLIVLGIGVCAFRSGSSPQQTLNESYFERYTNFRSALNSLRSGADSFKFSGYSSALLRERYLKVRSSYKSFEYLLGYADNAFLKEYLNGAPLPRLEENSFGPNVMEPSGLQVLDGIVFGDFNDSSVVQIASICRQLISCTEQYQPARVTSADLFASARAGLVRIYTLGLTGFDVPASANAIPDAIDALNAMSADLYLYAQEMKSKNALLSDSLFSGFEKTLSMLKSAKDFDRLDRFTLLKDGFDPLYSMILRMHIQLGYELPNETNTMRQAVNYRAVSIFDPKFLDESYFLNVPKHAINAGSIALGRILFFDPILSDNGQRACASCHDPRKAFSDGVPKSLAIDHIGTVKRNAPGLINCVYSDRYFHDLRSDDLTGQMEHVVTSTKEFNTSWDVIVKKLKQSSEYQDLFAAAFRSASVTAVNAQNVRFAMAAYIGSLNSFNSEFDRLIRGEKVVSKANANIVRGYNLFMGKAACGTCHFAPVFNGTVPPYFSESESEVLGVAADPKAETQVIDPDIGRGGALLKEQVDFYNYSFKTPGLRNIALTAPYMHNGAYADLAMVMDFYNKGGGFGFGLKVTHQTLAIEPLQLKKSEIRDIISFLEALSDNPFTDETPAKLPHFENNSEWNNRKPGGNY